MKTIFVPTDFSVAAENAAQYALAIARATGARVKLFNVFMVAAASPLAPQLAWPLYDYDAIVESTNAELNKLANKLTNQDDTRAVDVLTGCENSAGNVAEMISDKAVDERACLVVMGTSGAGDVFDGAFLHGLIAGLTPARAARLGVVAAGLKLRGRGAIASQARREEILLHIEADDA